MQILQLYYAFSSRPAGCTWDAVGSESVGSFLGVRVGSARSIGATGAGFSLTDLILSDFGQARSLGSFGCGVFAQWPLAKRSLFPAAIVNEMAYRHQKEARRRRKCREPTVEAKRLDWVGNWREWGGDRQATSRHYAVSCVWMVRRNSPLSHLVIEQFNPYSEQYPYRRVISRRELDFLKLLRAEGLDVRVSGNPSDELNYYSAKGIREWLSDPVILTLVGIPLSIVCGVISNLLSNKLAGKKLSRTDMVLELDKDGTRAHYTCEGTPLENGQLHALLGAMQERHKVHPSVTQLRSPYPDRQVPLFLEHTGQVVGWGRVIDGDRGLRVEDAVITDSEVWRRVAEGSLKGFSIGALVREARCEICGESYFECSHIAGQNYDGTPCHVRLTKLDLAEISIVESPVNPLARIHWKGNDR